MVIWKCKAGEHACPALNHRLWPAVCSDADVAQAASSHLLCHFACSAAEIACCIQAPQLVAAVLFTVFALKGTFLVPDVAFPALALINLLALPLFILPDQLANVVQGAVSLRRIQVWHPLPAQQGRRYLHNPAACLVRSG